MRWIVDSSLRLAAVVVVGVAVTLGVSVVALRHAPVDTLPEFLPPQVQVQTEALGLSTSEVEQFITVPLEDEFNGLPFLDHLRSQSVPGLSSIELTFKRGTDVYKARQLVTERVAQGPSVVNVGSPPVMIQPLSAESRVMMIGLSPKSLSMIDLSTLARWRIRPRLLAVPGVANVTIWGQRDQQLQVLVDPVRMARHRVSLEQVINTAGDAMWTSPLTFVEASSPGADGFIDVPNQRLSVQHILPIRTAKDLAEVPIEETESPLKLGAVTTVVEDHPALKGDAVLKNGPGFLLVVEKFPGANTLAVTRGVEAAMAELEPGLSGVEVDTTVFRPATFIEAALRDIGIAALIAFALVVLWLGLATLSWRMALIGAAAVALPVVVAADVLDLRGATFNTMTLAGLVIALGVVVDDAIVGVAAMRRRLDRERDPDEEVESRSAAVASACVEVRRPLGYALAIVVLAAVPLLLLGGLDGAFARPIMVSYLLAVLASTATALIVTPALGYLLLRPTPQERGSGLVERWVESGFALSVPAFLRRPRWAYAAVGLLVAIGGVTLFQRGSGPFIPAMQDRNLLVEWQAMPGTSLPEMERIAQNVDRKLRSTSGVRDVASHMGQSSMGDQVVNVDSAETWISLDPAADYGSALAAVRKAIDGFAGLHHSLLTYEKASLDAARTTSGTAITVRLYGTKYKALTAAAQRVRRLLTARVPGIVDPRVQAQPMEPAIQIKANVEAAARYGLKPGDIRRQTAVLIAGIPVGSYYRQQEIFDVTVWSEPVVRQNLTDIQRLLLDTPGGGHVPLSKVATVAIKPAPTEIDHDQVSRYLDVTAAFKGDDLGSALAEVKRDVQSVALPLGYHAEVSSELQRRQSAHERTLLAVLMVVAGILLLLQAAFQSWGRAALLLITLPLAGVGGLVAVLLAGRLMTVGALIGFITVLTIALRDGVLLIGRLRRQEREQPDSRGLDLVARATGEIAFPVVVTAVALALAVLPFVVRGTIPGTEVLMPLGLVVAGGLVTSTFYSLFILPALYLGLVARAPAADPATQREEGTS